MALLFFGSALHYFTFSVVGYGVFVVALFIALGPFVAAQADGDDPNEKTVEQGIHQLTC